jgi:DNA invertase Pin-like site-specific DNA recombinase
MKIVNAQLSHEHEIVSPKRLKISGIIAKDQKTNVSGRIFSYVRWSSDGQEFGDSERRQIQAAEAWCAHHGTKLSDERFVDAGVSAWKGANRCANLGRLLKTVRAGDVLLVEDNDRLSRQDWFTAMDFLRDIVSRGVKVVTLANGNEITEESFRRNPGVFLPAILKAYLGNDENEKRSYRIRQAMEARHEQIRTGTAVRGRLPAWLRWDGTLDKPVIVEEKAQVVRRIFKLCLDGYGVLAIEKELRDTPSISNHPRSSWNSRFIHRLLTDRSVIGCHVQTKTKDKPEVVTEGIYPTVISRDDFHAAAFKLKERKHLTVPIKHTGTALFTGLVRCYNCGRTLVKHTSKSNGKSYTYLVCSGGLRDKRKCESGSSTISYPVFEDTFLAMLAQDDRIRDAMSGGKTTCSKLDVLKGELATAQAEADKWFRAIEGDESPSKRIMDRLKQLEAREMELTNKIESEEGKTRASTPVKLAYEQTRRLLLQRIEGELDRPYLRELLRQVVNRVVVKLGQGEYFVYLKDVEKSFGVQIFAHSIPMPIDGSVPPALRNLEYTIN